MRLLLDTHIFLWWELEPEKLSSAALVCLEAEENQLIISMASIWEMQIKIQLGKLQLKRGLADVINRQRKENGLAVLPVEISYIIALEKLPSFHKDPFDRMLIAQAMTENIAIITADQAFHHYPINTIW
jgi:PIN domain nuclease of toxin-antitoxin system